jgi:hypothetical protein
VEQPGWTPLRPGEPFTAQLLAASRARRGLACAGAEVAADDLRAACLAAAEADPFGLRIDGATITGRLDLRACEVAVPLRFRDCRFTDIVNVRGAHLHELVFTGADASLPAGAPAGRRPPALPGLIAAGSRITRDLVLSGMVITGDIAARAQNRTTASVWLTEADIGGSVVMRGTELRPATGRALHADRVRVGGNIRLLDGFRATGEVRLLAMRLTGSLDLIGAEFAPADGRAIDMSEATVGGSVYLLSSPNTGRRCRVRGRIEMGHSTIHGELFIRNADLTAPAAGSGSHFYNVAPRAARTFLLAPRLTVYGALLIEGDTVVRGGRVDLNNAKIEGPINLRGTVLAAPPQRRCLTVVNARVAGDVRMPGLTALGGSLNFRGSMIAGVFDAEGAFVTNPGDKTINLAMAHVAGNVRLCGRFRVDGATLAWRPAAEPLRPPGEVNPRGCAFEAISADFRGGTTLGWRVLEGTVDLTGASSPFLADHPDRDWPAGSYLGGFSYERFEPVEARGDAVWDAKTRIAWLDRMEPFDPRAWERLAAVLRAAGDRDGADTVLVAPVRGAPAAGPQPGQPLRRRQGALPQPVLLRRRHRGAAHRPAPALHLVPAVRTQRRPARMAAQPLHDPRLGRLDGVRAVVHPPRPGFVIGLMPDQTIPGCR